MTHPPARDVRDRCLAPRGRRSGNAPRGAPASADRRYQALTELFVVEPRSPCQSALLDLPPEK
jgi:hypothetical protein